MFSLQSYYAVDFVDLSRTKLSHNRSISVSYVKLDCLDISKLKLG